ncbi:hypothetical protein CBS101457_004066 [Exobasidium rhododendri]|nr:hypothetical protein CBS101457_004066 [Exobasidium rhododendri]
MFIPKSIASSASPSTSSHVSEFLSSPAWVAALIGFKTTVQHQYQNKRAWSSSADSVDIVDLVICVVSVLGSLSIIIPYALQKGSRKLRHSLILGLATSDLVSSLIIIATSSYSLSGGNLSTATKFCSFAGYSFTVAVWTQNLWNLAIAIITYMILVHPLSSFVLRVERHLIWLWPIFWAIAFLVNGIAWAFVGFGNTGGYCGFDPKQGGPYFVAIFQFIPRGAVVLVVLVLYTHLFFFLRRVNMFNRANTSQIRHRSCVSQRSQDLALQPQSDAINIEYEEEKRTTSPNDFRHSKVSMARFDVGPKLHRLLSDTSDRSVEGGEFESDRTGSSSTQGMSSSLEERKLCKSIDEKASIEMIDQSEVSPKSKPLDALTPESNASSRQVVASVPIIRAPPQSQRSVNIKFTSDGLPGSRRPSTISRLPSYLSQQVGSADGKKEGEEQQDEEDDDSLDDHLHRMSPRKDVRDFGMTSAPREHLRHQMLSPHGRGAQQGKEEGHEGGGVRSLIAALKESEEEKFGPKAAVDANDESGLGQDWTWGMPVGESKKANHQQSAPSRKSKERFGSWWSTPSAKKDRVGVNSTASSFDENGVESLGSALNRQASVLLLLYPAAYCLLFSISIIRIIVDISEPISSVQEKIARNNNALHSISRWTIFAQGASDAIIFQLVERSFRQRLKRKRRIAAGEDLGEAWWKRLGQSVSHMWKRS